MTEGAAGGLPAASWTGREVRRSTPGRRRGTGTPWPGGCALLVLTVLAGCRGAMPRAAPDAPIDLAVTLDDLPATGPDVPPMSRAQVLLALADALRAHRVPAAGFVNAAQGLDDPDRRAAVAVWAADGHVLGNHTYSHPDLAAVGSDTFIADVDRNEPFLRDLAPPGTPERAWKIFRYPFLEEGATSADRAAVRAHLAARGYRIAPVTVDFADWGWNEPYARCAARGDARAVEALRQSYVSSALAALHWSDATARRLFGRPVKHILLLHVGAFDAVVLDDLLRAYRAAGVRFIGIEEALGDPVHRLDPGVLSTRNETLLHQVLRARGTPSALPAKPLALLDALCR